MIKTNMIHFFFRSSVLLSMGVWMYSEILANNGGVSQIMAAVLLVVGIDHLVVWYMNWMEDIKTLSIQIHRIRHRDLVEKIGTDKYGSMAIAFLDCMTDDEIKKYINRIEENQSSSS